MSAVDNDAKLAQFNEFFSIDYSFTINALRLQSDNIPDFEQFINRMPIPFKIASDMNTLDQSALRPLQTVAGVAVQLMEYLHHQAQKIDLLMGYILSQQDNQTHQYQATKFGGGGIIFKSNDNGHFANGDFLELKLFFSQENSAVYCLGEVVSTELAGEQYQHKVIFHHIREEDRELLVRYSLHQQSKHLQALAEERNKAK